MEKIFDSTLELGQLKFCHVTASTRVFWDAETGYAILERDAACGLDGVEVYPWLPTVEPALRSFSVRHAVLRFAVDEARAWEGQVRAALRSMQDGERPAAEASPS